jgi:hypothetical protein
VVLGLGSLSQPARYVRTVVYYHKSESESRVYRRREPFDPKERIERRATEKKENEKKRVKKRTKGRKYHEYHTIFSAEAAAASKI